MKLLGLFLNLIAITTLVAHANEINDDVSHLRGLVNGRIQCEDFSREMPCSRAIGCQWMRGMCKPNCGIFLRQGPCSEAEPCFWWKNMCVPLPKCEMFLRERPCNEAGACMWMGGMMGGMMGRCVHK